MMVVSKRPYLVINAIFYSFPSLMQTLLYPYLKSILVKIKALLSDSIKLAILGIGQQFFMVILLRALQSITGHKLPSCFFTKKNRAAIGLVDSWIYLFLSSSSIHMSREFLCARESRQTLCYQWTVNVLSNHPRQMFKKNSMEFFVGLQPYLYYYYSGCTLESHNHMFFPECSMIT